MRPPSSTSCTASSGSYLSLEWAEHDKERGETEARALLLAKAGGEKGGKRLFRNGVAFVVPEKAYADQARQLARRVLALDALSRKAKASHVQITPEQKDELLDKLTTAANDLGGACRGLYGHVLLPIRDKEREKQKATRPRSRSSPSGPSTLAPSPPASTFTDGCSSCSKSRSSARSRSTASWRSCVSARRAARRSSR
jgi:hypothetical protein